MEEFYDLSNYNAKIPLPQDYHPEIDTTKFLNDEGFSMWHSFMDIFRWCVELGRVDLYSVADLLDQYQALPKEVQLMSLGKVFT